MGDANVVLTGFMGTGKSTAGRLLADRLGRPFVDIDEQIVARVGCSIPEIFAEVAPGFWFAPWFDFDFDGAVGVRYYF